VPDERGQLRGEIVIGAAAEGHTGKTGDVVHIFSVIARSADSIAT